MKTLSRCKDSLELDKEIYIQALKNNSLNYNILLDNKENLTSHRIIFRYSEKTCLPCLDENLKLIESIFTKKNLQKELLFISSSDMGNLFPDYSSIVIKNIITPLDHNNEPYICFINKNGSILFSLVLRSSDFEWNKKILLMYKEYFINN